LDRLRSFVAVVEFGSLTRAAAALATSPSVLSRRIRQLESELHQHLLVRDGRGMAPTDTGRRLVAHGRGILHLVDAAQQDLVSNRVTPGKVAVGMPLSLDKRLAVGLVAHFSERYPEASINILTGQTETLVEWLQRGRLDFAILYGPVHLSPLVAEPWRTDAMCLIGPATDARAPGNQVSMGDLPRYPLIMHSLPNTLRNRIDLAARAQNIVLNVAMEIDDIEVTLDLIHRGLGYAVLSSQVIQEHPGRKLRASRIINPEIHRELFIATVAHRALSDLSERAIDYVRSQKLPPPRLAEQQVTNRTVAKS
jgi:LysR family transcriptional regulator, nitrogen assimilation regulatory protein